MAAEAIAAIAKELDGFEQGGATPAVLDEMHGNAALLPARRDRCRRQCDLAGAKAGAAAAVRATLQ